MTGRALENIQPGCLSRRQIEALITTLEREGTTNPSLLSDLEGCGPVANLEKAFAKAVNVKYALTVSSGTAAIHTALLAAGIGPGDEVIVTPYSWPQSVSPVLFTGASPVFADIDPETFNIDSDCVARLITPKTKAIIVVHLFGHMADMRRLEAIAKKAEVVLIADAAHAIGASRDGQSVGTWGDMACFSLGRGKLVSAGEGGVLATNHYELYEHAVALTQHPERLFRLTGRRNCSMGINYRIHPLAAVLALADLEIMPARLAHRQAVVDAFWDGLGKTDLLSRQAAIVAEKPVAYGLPLTFHGTAEGRDELVHLLRQHGVPTTAGPVSTPLHLRFSEMKEVRVSPHPTHTPGSCTVTEERCRRQEIMMLSALDADWISPDESNRMGQTVRQVVAEYF